jgi:hypothetical protein
VAEEKPNPKGWNVRPFPDSIKRECNARAGKEGKADWKWLADYLRKVLPLVQTSDSGGVLNSPDESGEAKVRRDSKQTDSNRTGKAIRRKAKKKI